MNIILLGPPGSGKGTQADLICKRKVFKHFSVGDILRSYAKMDKALADLLSKGEMAPLSKVEEATVDFFLKTQGNFVIDGLPRVLEQVSLLDRVMAKTNKVISYVFFLNLSDSLIRERIANRWLCQKNDGTVQILSSKEQLKCDGILTKRADDNPESLNKRLNIYHTETDPIIKEYRKRGLIIDIDASLGVEDVYTQIERYL